MSSFARCPFFPRLFSNYNLVSGIYELKRKKKKCQKRFRILNRSSLGIHKPINLADYLVTQQYGPKWFHMDSVDEVYMDGPYNLSARYSFNHPYFRIQSLNEIKLSPGFPDFKGFKYNWALEFFGDSLEPHGPSMCNLSMVDSLIRVKPIFLRRYKCRLNTLQMTLTLKKNNDIQFVQLKN